MEIIYKKETHSTNDDVRQLMRETQKASVVVSAEFQRNGRGQAGNHWESEKAQNLLFSIGVRPSFLPAIRQFLLLQVGAIAICQTLEEYADGFSIKWPNDILLDGKKLVGILSEMNGEYGKLNFVVIGIGINTHAEKQDFPKDVQDIAVSLHEKATKKFTREQILSQILFNLEKEFEEAEQNGFAQIFNEWRKLSCTLNKLVKVIAPDKTYLGKALDIDEAGMLVVQKDDGTIEKVVAGDVSIRAAE